MYANEGSFKVYENLEIYETSQSMKLNKICLDYEEYFIYLIDLKKLIWYGEIIVIPQKVHAINHFQILFLSIVE